MDDSRWLNEQELRYLEENIRISLDFLLYFLDSKVMTRYMIAKICSLPVASQRNVRFLQYLSRRNPAKGPRLFAEALYLSGQKHVLEKLPVLKDLVLPNKFSNSDVISLTEKPMSVKRFEEVFVEQNGCIPRQGESDIILKYYFTQKFGSAAVEKFYKSNPGLCVIINNMDFYDKPDSKRRGSELDVEKCEQCFGTLSYTIRKFNNLSKHGFMDVFDKVRCELEDCSFQSLVLIIMSHGIDDHVLTTDHEYLHIELDICMAFSSNNCPVLTDLPKVFIIQACQIVDVAPPRPEGDFDKYSLADMVVFCAAAPGSYANRFVPVEGTTPLPDKPVGSPFIYRLMEIIRQWGSIMTVGEIQLELNEYVERASGAICNTKLFTLKKEFLFRYPFGA